MKKVLVTDVSYSAISKNEAVNRLNNSVLDNKGVLQMEFGENKTPVGVIREGAFGGTHFRESYYSVNGKW